MFNNIKLAILEISIRPKEEMTISDLPSVMFRGGIGYTLKKHICHKSFYFKCKNCEMNHTCLYPKLFEEQPYQNENNGIGYVRPFLIRTDMKWENLKPTSTYSFHIHLFGEAISSFYHYIGALKGLGERGIGPNNVKFDLEKVKSKSALGMKNVVYDGKLDEINTAPYIISGEDLSKNLEGFTCSEIELTFNTPFRYQLEGELQKNIEFQALLTNIIRRIKALLYYHHGEIDMLEELNKWDENVGLITKINEKTIWYEIERHSTRTNTKNILGGLLGTVKFQGDFKELLPLLYIGQYLHIGKQTTFGLGHYELSFC